MGKQVEFRVSFQCVIFLSVSTSANTFHILNSHEGGFSHPGCYSHELHQKVAILFGSTKRANSTITLSIMMKQQRVQY